MILINLVLSTILALGLIFYRYVLKGKINLFYLLTIIAFLPIVSIFRTGIYESGDLAIHAERLISFYDSFFNNSLIPKWTPEFNAGYGEPYFLFSYFLPYLTGSIFHLIGFSYLNSIKLLLSISYLSSGLTMYLWVKKELNKRSGFVAAIFYLFMPYHLVDMHFRVTAAENLSFVFLPLILLGIKNVIEKYEKKWFIVLAISFGLLILSHQAITVMFFPLMIGYAFFTWFIQKNREIKHLVRCFLSILLGILIVSFYWMPIVFLAKFTQEDLYPAAIAFPGLAELLYSPWRYGLLFQGHKGELSYLIGYTQLFVLLTSLYFVFIKKLNSKLRKSNLFFLTVSLIIVFMILPISEPLWTIPFLKYSQYSTRLLVPLALCISILSGVVVKKINNKWFVIAICTITIAYTMLNWGNRRTLPELKDNYLKQQFILQSNSTLGPTSPIWATSNDCLIKTDPRVNIEITKGKGEIAERLRTPILHKYYVYAQSQIKVRENTLFFPGWTVIASDKQIPINYMNKKCPGVINFVLEKGEYDLSVKFADSPIVAFSKWLSLLAFFVIFMYMFSPKNKFG